MLEIVRHKVISRHYNDLLAGYFRNKKIKELVAKKYFWPSLKKDVETYIKGRNMYLISKAVRYKSYKDLQSLPVPAHRWKDFFMNFVTSHPISTDLKGNSYNSILVIIDRLIKMAYYESV